MEILDFDNIFVISVKKWPRKEKSGVTPLGPIDKKWTFWYFLTIFRGFLRFSLLNLYETYSICIPIERKLNFISSRMMCHNYMFDPYLRIFGRFRHFFRKLSRFIAVFSLKIASIMVVIYTIRKEIKFTIVFMFFGIFF